MSEDDRVLDLLQQENMLLGRQAKKDYAQIKELKRFIKQIVAFIKMAAPMHSLRSCKCEICDICRQARRITGP